MSTLSPVTTIDVSGITLAQRVYVPQQETQQPVILLHGWGASSELMHPVAERMVALGYRVYAPDLPGFGDSAPPANAWNVHDYAALVIAYLDAHDVQHCHLIGHSFGGRLGIILGATQSARISKLALVDSAGVPNKSDPIALARLRTYKGIRDGLYRVGATTTADKLRAWYGDRYGSADFRDAGVLRETFVKVVNENLLPFAQKISVPTLLLWGENDQDTPLWQAKTLETTIPDAGLVVFPNAGHYSYLEHLSDFVRIVDHFFRH
jgi:pimeloyl-ACP methyl ester carboxylesterase